jgi:hypothetical protein
MFSEIVDEVADTAHAELAEIAKVFSDLGGVQIELFGEFLRRDGFDSRGRQIIQATQIHA